jgi:hypothetical protein
VFTGQTAWQSNSLLEVVVFSKMIIDRTMSKRSGGYKHLNISSSHKCRTLFFAAKNSFRIFSGILPGKPAISSMGQPWYGKVRTGPFESDRNSSFVEPHLPKPTDRFSYELNNMVLNAILMA